MYEYEFLNTITNEHEIRFSKSWKNVPEMGAEWKLIYSEYVEM